jgi:hypothetical protein
MERELTQAEIDAEKTNNFAWALCCKIPAKLLENKYNIIIDGTAVGE